MEQVHTHLRSICSGVVLRQKPCSLRHVFSKHPLPPTPWALCMRVLLPPSRMQVSETEGALTRTYFSDAHKKAAQKVCGIKAVGQPHIARPLIGAGGYNTYQHGTNSAVVALQRNQRQRGPLLRLLAAQETTPRLPLLPPPPSQ